jgi:hypothetical protein
MSAPIDHRSFSVEDDFILCAAVWRGTMLDRYARCEALVLKCLLALRDAGFPLSSDAFSDGAKTRLRSLIRFLDDENFGGRAKAAHRHLNLLLLCTDDRAGLAHGRMRKHCGQLLIEWYRCRGPLKEEQRRLSPAAMLDELARLDKLSRDLSSEIGQVCRAIRERTS